MKRKITVGVETNGKYCGGSCRHFDEEIERPDNYPETRCALFAWAVLVYDRSADRWLRCTECLKATGDE